MKSRIRKHTKNLQNDQIDAEDILRWIIGHQK